MSPDGVRRLLRLTVVSVGLSGLVTAVSVAAPRAVNAGPRTGGARAHPASPQLSTLQTQPPVSHGPLAPPLIVPLVSTTESLDGSEGVDVAGDQTTVRLATDVLFAFGKSDLSTRAGRQLDSVAAKLGHAKGTVTVTGYTDSVGSDSVNLPLSRARAQAVADGLHQRARGLTFTVAGKGSAEPVADNTTDGKDNPAGRSRNRRVEISFGSA